MRRVLVQKMSLIVNIEDAGTDISLSGLIDSGCFLLRDLSHPVSSPIVQSSTSRLYGPPIIVLN